MRLLLRFVLACVLALALAAPAVAKGHSDTHVRMTSVRI